MEPLRNQGGGPPFLQLARPSKILLLEIQIYVQHKTVIETSNNPSKILPHTHRSTVVRILLYQTIKTLDKSQVGSLLGDTNYFPLFGQMEVEISEYQLLLN